MTLLSAAIQGEIGSPHHTAALKLLGEDTVIVPRQTVGEVFETLQTGRVNYAVVAIEDSFAGPMQETHDLLRSRRFKIKQELWLSVEYCLFGLANTPLEAITAVYSRPAVLAQCQTFLQTVLPQAKQAACDDTIGAIHTVGRWQDPSKAAVAEATMAGYTDLSVLARNINDQPDNKTKFLLLSQ